MAVDRQDRGEFDYIVVGSGAGGGPLAANLTRAGFTVLVLEAGGDRGSDLISRVPAFHPKSAEDPQMSWEFFVKRYNDPTRESKQNYTAERNGTFYPRAATLGGCTSHHAMITVYPHNGDWNQIAFATGDQSWLAENMRGYFQRMENCRYIAQTAANPGRHGYGGWLTTETANPRALVGDKELINIVKAAVKEGLSRNRRDMLGFLSQVLAAINNLPRDASDPTSELARLLDPNDWSFVKDTREGVVLTPVATEGGQRRGPREYLLETLAEFPNLLTIETYALATRVVLDDNKRARAVEYSRGAHLYAADPDSGHLNQEPELWVARARREVILAGGAYNTPQLLMLSGIGPAEQLSQHGISPVLIREGVGKNLQDRYEVGLVFQAKKPFAALKDATFEPPVFPDQGDPHMRQWLDSGTGLYSSNGVVIALIARSKPELLDPDLFIFGTPGIFTGYRPGYSDEAFSRKDRWTWLVLKAHTKDTAGEVTLNSASPYDVPAINFHYFDEGTGDYQADTDAVAEGVKIARSMSNRASNVLKKELFPGPKVRAKKEVPGFIQQEAWGHHASCSCKMGKADDPMAVVDSKFRVIGTQGLRIVDASIFPKIPGFFIVTAIYMISEKAADDIIAAAPSML